MTVTGMKKVVWIFSNKDATQDSEARPSKGSGGDGCGPAEKKERKKVLTTYFRFVGSVPSKKKE